MAIDVAKTKTTLSHKFASAAGGGVERHCHKCEEVVRETAQCTDRNDGYMIDRTNRI